MSCEITAVALAPSRRSHRTLRQSLVAPMAVAIRMASRRAVAPRMLLPCIVIVSLLVAHTPASAQDADAATRTRLWRLLSADAAAPGGKGVLPMALAEARIATEQALRAAEATDLTSIQTYARGVVHAVDPTLGIEGGPGLGYGVKRAMGEVIRDFELTRAVNSKPDVAVLGARALTAAQNVVRWADALVVVAQRIQAATSVREASGLTRHMAELARQLTAGTSPTPAQRATLGPGEGGLLVVQSSLAILLIGRGEVVPTALRERAQ